MCEVFCLNCIIAKYNKVVPAGTSDARHQYYDKGEFFVSKQPQLITMHSSKQRVGCMHQLRSRAFGIAKRSFPKLLTTTPSCMNVYKYIALGHFSGYFTKVLHQMANEIFFSSSFIQKSTLLQTGREDTNRYKLIMNIHILRSSASL